MNYWKVVSFSWAILVCTHGLRCKFYCWKYAASICERFQTLYIPLEFHVHFAEFANELNLCSQFESRPVDAEYVRLMHDVQSLEIAGHTYRGYTLLTQNDRRQRSISVRKNYSIPWQMWKFWINSKHFRLISVENRVDLAAQLSLPSWVTDYYSSWPEVFNNFPESLKAKAGVVSYKWLLSTCFVVHHLQNNLLFEPI